MINGIEERGKENASCHVMLLFGLACRIVAWSADFKAFRPSLYLIPSPPSLVITPSPPRYVRRNTNDTPPAWCGLYGCIFGGRLMIRGLGGFTRGRELC